MEVLSWNSKSYLTRKNHICRTPLFRAAVYFSLLSSDESKKCEKKEQELFRDPGIFSTKIVYRGMKTPIFQSMIKRRWKLSEVLNAQKRRTLALWRPSHKAICQSARHRVSCIKTPMSTISSKYSHTRDSPGPAKRYSVIQYWQSSLQRKWSLPQILLYAHLC
jgi:hypothetical protein